MEEEEPKTLTDRLLLTVLSTPMLQLLTEAVGWLDESSGQLNHSEP